MNDLQIKVSKIKQLPGLVMVEILGLTEVYQILVVCEDLNRERGAVEVVSSRLSGMDDC